MHTLHISLAQRKRSNEHTERHNIFRDLRVAASIHESYPRLSQAMGRFHRPFRCNKACCCVVVGIVYVYFILTKLAYEDNKRHPSTQDGHNCSKRSPAVNMQSLSFRTSKNFTTLNEFAGCRIVEGVDILKDRSFDICMPFVKRDLTLLVGVLSHSYNLLLRTHIRETWAKFTGDWQLLFIVGYQHANRLVKNRLNSESQRYQDMLLVYADEKYSKLSEKTLLWLAAANSLRPKFMLKSDDDSFVHIHNVIHWLSNTQCQSRLYAGRSQYSVKPDHDENSKWYVGMEAWPSESYPPFNVGAGYLLSSDVAHCIVTRARQSANLLLPLEDVQIGWLAQQCGYVPEYMPGVFSLGMDNLVFTPDMFFTVFHYVNNPFNMYMLWESTQNDYRLITKFMQNNVNHYRMKLRSFVMQNRH